MVIENLKLVLSKNKDIKSKEFLRNLLKEELQLIVLNFIYTNLKYKNLIFTGGTCLRKFYGLGRLSEDLDFDFDGDNFNYDEFANDLIKYFKSDLQYKNVSTKYKYKTIFLKLPVLREIGYAGPNESEVLMLRIDISNSYTKNCGTELKIFDSIGYSYVARTYDFSTLVANKIVAFLTRVYKKGDLQKVDFKGRDAFDLVWMFGELNLKKIKINFERVKELVEIDNIDELKTQIFQKSKNIKSSDLYYDLKNFFKDDDFVKQYCDSYQELLETSLVHFVSAPHYFV